MLNSFVPCQSEAIPQQNLNMVVFRRLPAAACWFVPPPLLVLCTFGSGCPQAPKTGQWDLSIQASCLLELLEHVFELHIEGRGLWIEAAVAAITWMTAAREI